MRTGDLRAREDFDAILATTLSNHWTRTTGQTVQARPDDGGEGQLWQDHSLLSGIFSQRPSDEVVRFMRDEIRYTPVIHRAPAQWLLGSLCASRPGLKAMTRPVLRVSPPVDGAEHLLILTGHRRLRLLDFAGNKTLTVVKHGYDPRCVSREVHVRREDGPFLPLGEVDPAGAWIEEPLIRGRSLPRVHGAARRTRVAQEALTSLDRWQRERATEVSTDEHLTPLLTRIHQHLATLKARHGADTVAGMESWVDTLEEEARARDVMEVCITQGDLQPGNILLDLERDEAFVVDLEYAATRSRVFDLLTWGLQARPLSRGLDHRVRAFIAEGELHEISILLPESRDPQWRRWAAAIFLLEDMEALGEEATSGQPTDPGHGWRSFLETLQAMSTDDTALFGGPRTSPGG